MPLNMETDKKESDSFYARIWIAGEYLDAKRICADYCTSIGLCVTVTKTCFVYSGGQEDGVVVGLLNYPRFPGSDDGLIEKAATLGNLLMIGLSQGSFLIESPKITTWLSRRGDVKK